MIEFEYLSKSPLETAGFFYVLLQYGIASHFFITLKTQDTFQQFFCPTDTF